MSVGTCTFDFSTRIVMKVSSDGIAEVWSTEKPVLVGVAGGEGRAEDGAGPHWITSTAFAAR